MLIIPFCGLSKISYVNTPPIGFIAFSVNIALLSSKRFSAPSDNTGEETFISKFKVCVTIPPLPSSIVIIPLSLPIYPSVAI